MEKDEVFSVESLRLRGWISTQIPADSRQAFRDHLTEIVYKVVVQNSIPAETCRLILDY